MENTKLIDELYKASKAGIVGIDNIKDEVEDKGLLDLIQKQNNYYEKFAKDMQKIAIDYDYQPKDINIFMKAGSFMESKMKTMMDDSSHTIAELMINGTKMGINQLNELIHEYEDCDEKLINYAKEFKSKLEAFLNSLHDFV